MYLISKTGPRANSRKGTPEYQSENTNNMESATYTYAAGSPHAPKMVKRRESRIRSSFFGGSQVKRESYELSPEDIEVMRSPSRSMTSSSDDKENISFLSRRKLRKSSSHASLSSAAYAYEHRQEKVGRKGFADLLRGAKTPPIRQPAGTKASFFWFELLLSDVQVNGIIRSASHSTSTISHMAILSNSLVCNRLMILHWFGTGTMLYGIPRCPCDGILSKEMNRRSS